MSQSVVDDKPAQTGLVDMGDISFYNDPSDPDPTFSMGDLDNYAGSFSEMVLNVTWAELEPTAGGQLDTDMINCALAAVENYNSINGTDVGIKLRVWGGYTAPDWAKNIDGPAITITGDGSVDPKEQVTETIGRFWTADYIDAWTVLQNDLAQTYDSNPLIRGISNTAGAAATDEPFVPLHAGQENELEAGGYRDAAEQLTLRNAVADYGVWSTTPLDYTMNLFHDEDDGTFGADANFTLAVLQEAENSSHLVQAGNHALQNPLYQPDSFIYAQLAADAALDPSTVPASYQTGSPVVLGPTSNWNPSIAQGVTADAGDIELWDFPETTGFTGQTSSFVAALAGTLANGIAPTITVSNGPGPLGFLAPGAVSGAAGSIALAGTNAVLLVSATAEISYLVTISSANGNMLSVYDAAVIPETPGAAVSPVEIYGADGQVLTPSGAGQTVSSTSLTFSAPLSLINTILASLTEKITSGSDLLSFVATDSSGNVTTHVVGVVAEDSPPPPASAPVIVPIVISASATTFQWTGEGGSAAYADQGNWSPSDGPPSSSDTADFNSQVIGNTAPIVVGGTGAAGTLIIDASVVLGGDSDIAVGSNDVGDVEIADSTGSSGTLIVAGVDTTLTIAGNLVIGGTAEAAGGTGSLIAALSPSDYNTAVLTIDGDLAVWGQGSLQFAGLLAAAAVTVSNGGLISGDGVLTATGPSAIVNDGTIESISNQTVGLEELTLTSAVAGSGAIVIDAAATLVLEDAIGPKQTIEFAPASVAQISDDPYAPTTLELENPNAFLGSITGFSDVDSLVLNGIDVTSVSYTDGTLTLDLGNGDPALTLALSGELADLDPSLVTSGSGATATASITFVADHTAQPATAIAPATLHAVTTIPVLVPGIVLDMPLPASLPTNTSIMVTFTAETGTLSASTDNGNTLVGQPTAHQLVLSGSLGAVQSSLQTLQYAGGTVGSDTIAISVTDVYGTSPGTVVAVTNDAAGCTFYWTGQNGNNFALDSNWEANQSVAETAPGGADTAIFDADTATVGGDGAVGDLEVFGSLTLAGVVVAQGVTPTGSGDDIATILNGSLTVASGASLTDDGTAEVGVSGTGMLTVAGGELALNDLGASLVLGLGTIGQGTVFDLGQIEAVGAITVGMTTEGTIHVMGASAALTDGAADIGEASGANGLVVVDGGEWTNSGTLIVGDLGTGSVTIGGTASGITGQVTAFDATIGAQSGGSGTITLNSGDFIVGNDSAASSGLIVGAAASGLLTLNGNSDVNVGVAQTAITIGASAVDNTGTLIVGGFSGGAGTIVINDSSSLLVDGGGTIGGGGIGSVEINATGTASALLALGETLTIGSEGSVALSGPLATLRASVIAVVSGGTVSGDGTISGDGGGGGTVILADVVNAGLISAENGNLLVYGAVMGDGALAIGNDASLTLQAAVASGQVLTFGQDALGTLDDATAFQGTICGFSSSDVLDLASTNATSVTWNDDVLTLVTTDGSVALNLAGDYDTNSFIVQSDGLGGTVVQLACFVSGTRIMTPVGQRSVEDLKIGDLVVTVRGIHAPINWIGHRRLNCARHPNPDSVRPVRIAPHAFGFGLPQRNLYLSPDHAVYFEDVLIPIKYLINGSTVAQVDASDVTYYHVELPHHDVVLAEGLPAETYLETGHRSAFGNNEGPVDLHPSFTPHEVDAQLLWDARGYAPLVITGPVIECVRNRVTLEQGNRLARVLRRS